MKDATKNMKIRHSGIRAAASLCKYGGSMMEITLGGAYKKLVENAKKAMAEAIAVFEEGEKTATDNTDIRAQKLDEKKVIREMTEKMAKKRGAFMEKTKDWSQEQWIELVEHIEVNYKIALKKRQNEVERIKAINTKQQSSLKKQHNKLVQAKLDIDRAYASGDSIGYLTGLWDGKAEGDSNF